jgi:hypothetical protein
MAATVITDAIADVTAADDDGLVDGITTTKGASTTKSRIASCRDQPGF